MISLPLSGLLLILLLFLLPIFFFLVQIEVVKIALGKLGLSPGFAFLIVMISLVGSLINIPLCTREATVFASRHPGSFLGGVPFLMPPAGTRQIIALNVGGALVPLLLCIFLLPRTPVLPTFFATLISTIICFKLSRVVPGLGVTIPSFIPPLVAVLLAWSFSPGNKIPVAYISGVLGVLIGADLLNLPYLGNGPGIMSIGGAGVYDGIFLVGIISALLA